MSLKITPKIIFHLLRVKQWNKNFFIFAPLIFSKKLSDFTALTEVIIAYFLFSLAASSTYIFNDIIDIKRDKEHPEKKLRPIASGNVSIFSAGLISLILCASSLFLSTLIKPVFGLIILTYVILNIVYSLILKNMVILDVMAISAGFVLRIIAGSEIIEIYPSNWLIICTILLSLFLGFSKRRHEIVMLTNNAKTHRRVLAYYGSYFLDQMIVVTTATTVMSYLLYTVSEDTVRFFGTRNLIWTVPFVFYGIFRYLYLIHQKDKGGDPAEVMFKDIPMFINILLWMIVCILIIYVI